MVVIGLPNDLRAKEYNDKKITYIEDATIGNKIKIYGVIWSDNAVVISGFNSGDSFKGEVNNFYINDSTDMLYVDFPGGQKQPKFTIYDSPHLDEKNREFYTGDHACTIGNLEEKNGEPVLYLESISDSPDGFYSPNEDILDFMSTLIMPGLLLIINLILLLFIFEYYNISTKWSRSKLSRINIVNIILAVFFILYLISNIHGYYLQEEVYITSTLILVSSFIALVIISQIIRVKDENNQHHRRFVFVNDKNFEKYYDMGEAIEKILDKNGFKHTKFDKKALGLYLIEHGLMIQLYDATRKMRGIKLCIKPVTAENRNTIVELLKKLFDQEFDSDKWLD